MDKDISSDPDTTYNEYQEYYSSGFGIIGNYCSKQNKAQKYVPAGSSSALTKIDNSR
jgi:hypothetical protein